VYQFSFGLLVPLAPVVRRHGIIEFLIIQLGEVPLLVPDHCWVLILLLKVQILNIVLLQVLKEGFIAAVLNRA